MNITQHGKGCRDPAGGGMRQEDDVGQASLFHAANRNDCARQLHQGKDAFLHAGTAGGWHNDQRGTMFKRGFGRLQDTVTNSASHGPAHEFEIKGGDNRFNALDAATPHHDRVLDPVLVAGILEPVGIAFEITELERVILVAFKRDNLSLTLIKQHGEAFGGSKRHVIAAGRTGVELFFEFTMKDHLVAG